MFIRDAQRVAEIHAAQKVQNAFLRGKSPTSAAVAVALPVVLDMGCSPHSCMNRLLTLAGLRAAFYGQNGTAHGTGDSLPTHKLVKFISGRRGCSSEQERHDNFTAAVVSLQKQYDLEAFTDRLRRVDTETPFLNDTPACQEATHTLAYLHALWDIQQTFGSTHLVVIPEADMRALAPELFAA